MKWEQRPMTIGRFNGTRVISDSVDIHNREPELYCTDYLKSSVMVSIKRNTETEREHSILKDLKCLNMELIYCMCMCTCIKLYCLRRRCNLRSESFENGASRAVYRSVGLGLRIKWYIPGPSPAGWGPGAPSPAAEFLFPRPATNRKMVENSSSLRSPEK